MIIINDELLSNVFGKERVPFCKDILMHALNELIKREAYGKDITAITMYEPQCDSQKYVDNWMNSTIAKTEVAEYYKELSFKGEDDMNKYETLLKKYGKLSREFEAYKEVTEDIADKGTYITNEALEELLECKKKYDTLFKEHKAYCYASEDVAVKLIETEKKYDALQEENERLKKERDDLVKEVYYLHEVINEKNSKCKEKMEKIKQRDKQITELIAKNNKQHADYAAVIKERDELKQRLEHVNTMSNLEWKFEVVEETETTRTPYNELVTEEQIKEYNKANTETSKSPWDELVEFCENHGVCVRCPNRLICDNINAGFKPKKWNEDEIAEYNELIAMTNDKEDK